VSVSIRLKFAEIFYDQFVVKFIDFVGC